jgi:hypothetical protein
MLPKKHPKQKLEITAPLIRHAVESLETPLNNTLNSDATTSSESTVKANHRGDEIGSGTIARDAVEIGTDGIFYILASPTPTMLIPNLLLVSASLH